MSDADVLVRTAVAADADAVAGLHVARITEGFLSSLGAGFLRRLYRRIVASPEGFVLVAVADGRTVGFAAGVTDVGRLYREFLLRDGLAAGVVAAPRLVRSWRQVLETLRYPAGDDDLPPAEVLSVAVAAHTAARGVGRRLVHDALDEFRRRGTSAVKVVAGADNVAALALYAGCDFVPRARIAVHEGTPSEVLVWSSS